VIELTLLAGYLTMQFKTISSIGGMTMNIYKILKDVRGQKRGKTEYYNILDFQETLENTNKYIETEEVLLVPFYLTNTGTLEIYEYQLYIRVVDSPCFTEYMLKMTGKRDKKDIEEKYWNLRKNCDIEVIKGEYNDILQQVKNYVEYLLDDDELSRSIKDYLGEFHNANLYFAVY